MKKVFGITGIVIAALPFALISLLIVLFIVVSLVTGVINEIDGQLHTEQLLNSLSNGFDEEEIVDTYTFVGNTGPAGNHCEALSAVLVRANNDLDVYYWGNGCNTICKVDVISEYDSLYSFVYDDMKLPEDTGNLYLLVDYNSVPFPDRIKGH